MNLSGGQRARIGLARAIYSSSNIVLLDDVLSAEDVEVGRKIFHEAIISLLLKKHKATVVLVTHQHQFCHEPEVTNNVLMINGSIEHVGDYNSCVEKSAGKVTMAAADEKEGGKGGGGWGGFLKGASPAAKEKEVVAAEIKQEVAPADDGGDDDEAFTEDISDGKVTLKTWVAYARAMGGGTSLVAFFVAVFLMTGGQALLVMSTAQLGKWGEAEDPKSHGAVTKIWILVGSTALIRDRKSVV